MYKVLDLHDLERTFSAYQRQLETMSSMSSYDSKVVIRTSTKPKELSLVDGRRAQNCTILLSKLKMTSQSLAHAVLTMDTQEELPKDMCEQVSSLTTLGDRPPFSLTTPEVRSLFSLTTPRDRSLFSLTTPRTDHCFLWPFPWRCILILRHLITWAKS